MKKEAILVVIIFLLLVSVVGSSEDKVDDIIEEKLLEEDRVKVIVVLKDDVKEVRKLSARSVPVKIQVLEKLDKQDFVKKRDYSGGFSGEIDEEGLKKLKRDKNIRRVEYDYPIKAFLQDSVGLINASVVHGLDYGDGNIEGRDETICIIDTGINYSHVVLGGCSNETFLAGDCNKVLDGYDFVNDDNDPIDDAGHGTSVAGIAAADGIGVAPGANIIAIKVLDDNGIGYISDAISGVDWCVNNASQFNISVISLSLGTDSVYDSFCDSDYSGLTDVINSAVEKNITVVAASGNSGSLVGISSPACIENVTSIGGTDKRDNIGPYTNRVAILDLLAPGSSINSTSIGGGYVNGSGTSMATPHVAGVIALLQQFNKEEKNLTLILSGILDVLNRTGKQIEDENQSNLTFSRIDVWGAIADLTKPIVDLISPSNNSVLDNITVNFNVSFDDYEEYLNCSLYIDDEWNQTNNLTSNGDIFSVNLDEKDYNSSFICYYNLSVSDESELINFRIDVTEPIIYLESPEDSEEVAGSKFNSTNTYVGFSFNVSDVEIENCSLLINGNLNATDTSISVNISHTMDVQLRNDTYNWSVQCYDKVGWLNISEERQVNVSCTEDWVCDDWSDWSNCSDGEKTRTKTCVDDNVCGTTSSKPDETDTSSSGCGDSDDDDSDDSGGSSGTTEETTTESVLTLTGDVNDVKSFSISKDVGITGVSVELKNAVSNAKLNVKKLSEKPSSVTALDNVNRYIQIDLSGASNDDVKEAIIKFKVAKTWIIANAESVNHVYMQRYNGGKWEKLVTLTAGGDDDYQKYQATASGFSYFAVNAEKTPSLITASVIEERVANNETVTKGNETNVTKKGFDFRDLFSGSIVKNLREGINLKGLFGKSVIYNVIFVVIIILMLIGVTYKYREIISKSEKLKGKFKKPNFKFKKPNFSKIKNKYDKIRRGVKTIKEKREKIRAVKVKAREKNEAIKIKTRRNAKVIEKKEEEAKLERYEIKDRGKEKWEDFDLDSGWDEGE